jgi:hypothetical protein
LTELNEIKKALYKQNIDAYFVSARKDGLFYQAHIITPIPQLDIWEERKDREVEVKIISFLVPLNEIGETVFDKTIPAKLLIRYIIHE